MRPLPVLTEPEFPSAPPAGAVRLACVQNEPRVTRNEDNLAATVAILEQARELGATLVCFPEASLTGYCFRDPEEARRFGVRRNGPELAAVADACRRLDVSAVVSYIEDASVPGDAGTAGSEVAGPPRLANSATIVGPGGIAAHYRKTHLPHLGVDKWVAPGCEPLTPVDAAGLRTGVLICYDASFPEAARTLALRGADLILLPTNWPAEAVAKAEWLPNTRAYENVVYFAAVNRVGEERGYVFHGASRICGPTGETLVQGPRDTEAMLIADVDPERARTKRIVRREGEYWVDRIGDRREDLYDLRAMKPPDRDGDS